MLPLVNGVQTGAFPVFDLADIPAFVFADASGRVARSAVDLKSVVLGKRVSPYASVSVGFVSFKER
ncbi:hypothetical protein, partial [Nocardiopsis changdeensis]|uniref:hypothetical protein n=1 Tax=Nocardiopsis changdeensis TaxID=2831969 RepID=UPI003F46BDED